MNFVAERFGDLAARAVVIAVPDCVELINDHAKGSQLRQTQRAGNAMVLIDPGTAF